MRVVFAFCLMPYWALAAPSTRQVHGPDGDFTLSCQARPIARDYLAQTSSGTPPADPYAVARGADQGLVRRMDEGGRRAKSYHVAKGLIRAMVRVAEVSDLPERVDLIFTQQDVRLVHTFAANAGIFTQSDVYVLRYGAGGVDTAPLARDADVAAMARLGLARYDLRSGRCLL